MGVQEEALMVRAAGIIINFQSVLHPVNLRAFQTDSPWLHLCPGPAALNENRI